MDAQVRNHAYSTSQISEEEDMDIRKGPWSSQEDSILAHYISIHGEGHWNTAARCAGLKRTGKSCRLRWLNYLRPDVRRGNITLQEQLKILELHSRWGNRWSKIAQQLPGRTDNEIKNYWRTRVQKQAKQLKCDVNSREFREAMRYVWIPRLKERIGAESESAVITTQPALMKPTYYSSQNIDVPTASESERSEWLDPNNFMPEMSSSFSNSLESQFSPGSDLTNSQNPPNEYCSDYLQNRRPGTNPEIDSGSWGWYSDGVDMQAVAQERYGLGGAGDSLENFWNEENIRFLHQQLM